MKETNKVSQLGNRSYDLTYFSDIAVNEVFQRNILIHKNT